MKTIILDLSDVYSYLVQVMHFQTQYYVSDIVSFLDYHIWRKALSIYSSVVIFYLNQRVKWLLIFLLIVTFYFFAYNE